MTAISCVDGAGGTVNATVNLAARKMTLPDIPAPPTAAAGPITCTYTNTYTPKATLTLVKAVDGGTATAGPLDPERQRPHADHGSLRLGERHRTSASLRAPTRSQEAGSPLGYTSQGWACTGGALWWAAS